MLLEEYEVTVQVRESCSPSRYGLPDSGVPKAWPLANATLTITRRSAMSLFVPMQKQQAEEFTLDAASAFDRLIESGEMRSYPSLDVATAAWLANTSNPRQEPFAVVQIDFRAASDAVLCSADAPAVEYFTFNRDRQLVSLPQRTAFYSWKFNAIALRNLKQHALKPTQIWLRLVSNEQAEKDLSTWMAWAQDVAAHFGLQW